MAWFIKRVRNAVDAKRALFALLDLFLSFFYSFFTYTIGLCRPIFAPIVWHKKREEKLFVCIYTEETEEARARAPSLRYIFCILSRSLLYIFFYSLGHQVRDEKKKKKEQQRERENRRMVYIMVARPMVHPF